jgi:hypothetical protein
MHRVGMVFVVGQGSALRVGEKAAQEKRPSLLRGGSLGFAAARPRQNQPQILYSLNDQLQMRT